MGLLTLHVVIMFVVSTRPSKKSNMPLVSAFIVLLLTLFLWGFLDIKDDTFLIIYIVVVQSLTACYCMLTTSSLLPRRPLFWPLLLLLNGSLILKTLVLFAIFWHFRYSLIDMFLFWPLRNQVGTFSFLWLIGVWSPPPYRSLYTTLH